MLQEAATDLFQQLQDFLVQCKEEDYSRPLEELGGSSVGQHVRHSIEFFICLLNGIDNGRVNYDERKHDQLLETSKQTAQGKLAEMKQALEFQAEDAPFVLEANYHTQDGSSIQMNSSFNRELAYTVEHTIHHMAVIAVGVRVSLSYIQLPKDFGVARSTLRFRETQTVN